MAGRENEQQSVPTQDIFADVRSPELTASTQRALQAAAYLETCGVDLSSAGIRIVTNPREMYTVENDLYTRLHDDPCSDADVSRSFEGAKSEQSFYLVLEAQKGKEQIPVLASRTGFSPPADEVYIPKKGMPAKISAALKEKYPRTGYADVRFLARVAKVIPPQYKMRGGFRTLALARLLLLQADWYLQKPSLEDRVDPLVLMTKARLENSRGGQSSAERWLEILPSAGYTVDCLGNLDREPSIPRAVLIAGIAPDEAVSVFEQTKRAFSETADKLRTQNPAFSF